MKLNISCWKNFVFNFHSVRSLVNILVQKKHTGCLKKLFTLCIWWFLGFLGSCSKSFIRFSTALSMQILKLSLTLFLGVLWTKILTKERTERIWKTKSFQHEILNWSRRAYVRHPWWRTKQSWPLFSPTFFFFNAFCFSPTSGNLPWLKICFPQYFGITRRNM